MSTLAAACVACAALALPPDLITPGNKSVRHELSLDVDETFAEWRFLAAPTAGFRGVTTIEAGQPFRFSSKYGTRIYALPAGEAPPERCTEEWAAGRPQSEPGVGEIGQVSILSPLARVLTRLRVVEVSEGALKLERVGEERWDSSGTPIGEAVLNLYLGGIAAVGFVGLLALWLRSRKRRRLACSQPTS